MVLVGRLVGRETCVAVEAVGTVLHLHVGYLRVERHNPSQCLLHAPFKLCSDGLVFLLVFLEPLAVIVGHYLPQET